MVIILHNPLSKNKKSKRTTKKVVESFKAKGIPFRLKSLLKIKDIEDYLKNTPKEVNLLLLGGDGTINTFINKTYTLPCQNKIFLKGNGSGNDFLRYLNKNKSSQQAIMSMRYNDKKRHFINGSGLGMDGEIAHRVNQAKKKSRFNYVINALKTFATYKPKYMEVIIDGELHTFEKGYLINVNSGQFIGGGMKITPQGDVSDDLLDIVVVHSISKFMLFLIFITVFFGFHTKFKRYVFYKKGKHVKASMFSQQVAQCDGETFERTREIEITHSKKYTYFKPYDLNEFI